MPLDSAQYISEFNLSNPNGAVDTVDMLDDFIREVKRAVQQSFPNINKQTTISSDALNNLANFLKYSHNTWDFQTVPVLNVGEADDDTAVEPRLYNDGRYAMLSKNLEDIPNKNTALGNLFTGLDPSNEGTKAMLATVAGMLYPIGTVYTNGSVSTNPATLFGVGTWAAFAEGRALVGVGTNTDSRGETRTFTNGQLTGAYQHVLTQDQMPAHQHIHGKQWGGSGGLFGTTSIGNSSGQSMDWIWNSSSSTPLTSSVGSNQAHNITQPVRAAYIWIRTA